MIVLPNQDFDEIIPGLFVGSFEARAPPNKWDAVVTIVSFDELCKETKDFTTNLVKSPADLCIIQWKDGHWGIVAECIRENVLPFINRNMGPGRRVLIHCLAGVSRSPTVAAMFLLSSGFSHSVDHAVEFIKTKRDIADPHFRFIEELKEWHAQKK